jgi:hydrophobic/amphiphilic exporter-1 (mainly G- bacteria), HAE1 family
MKRSSLITGRPEMHVQVDRAKAEDAGLTVADVGDVVETAIAGRRHTLLLDGGRDVDVNLLLPPERVRSEQDLLSVPFLSPDGHALRLGQVASVSRRSGPLSVRRLERQRNVLLTVNISPTAPLGAVVERVEREVFPPVSASLGSAYTLGLGGAADKLKTTVAALTQGFLLSVVLIYLLLVALFSSWTKPIVIIVTVPLAMAGGVLGIAAVHHWTEGAAGFDVISMLGFVILAGIVVNNAILIVHQANNLVATGMAAREALVRSSATRLRPILMSVITTVVGMLPLAIGGGAGAELYQGLAAVIVGGLTLSTLFTLFVVPAILSLGHDIRRV